MTFFMHTEVVVHSHVGREVHEMVYIMSHIACRIDAVLLRCFTLCLQAQW